MAWLHAAFVMASILIASNAAKLVEPRGSLGMPSWALAILCLLVYLVLLSAYNYAIYPRYFSPNRDLPMAKGAVFPFGHAARMFKEPPGVALARLQQDVEAEATRQGQRPQAFFRILYGGKERLVAASPEASAQVFLARSDDMAQSSVVVALLETSIGKTVMSAAGDEHRALRKSLVPALAPDFVRQLAGSSWRAALRLRDQLQAECVRVEASAAREGEGEGCGEHSDGWVTLDVFPWMLSGFLCAFASVALGVDVDNETLGRELLQHYETVYPIKPGRVGVHAVLDKFMPAFLPKWLVARLPKSPRTKAQMRARDQLSKIYLDLVHERFGSKEVSGKADILDRMCSREFNVEPENAVRHLHALMAAGHETTSCAMAWAMVEMARDPVLQQRLRDEVQSAVGMQLEDGASASMDATTIDSLEFLHCFVMEVLRVYPSVSFLPRLVCNDVVICDQPLPRGTVVYLSIIGHNCSRDVFGPDAEEFRPERWRTVPQQQQQQKQQNGADGHAGVAASAKNIHTFGHGARGCLGRDYATRVLKCFTAALVSRFEMEPVPGHVVEFRSNSSTLRPKEGLPLRLRLLEKQ